MSLYSVPTAMRTLTILVLIVAFITMSRDVPVAGSAGTTVVRSDELHTNLVKAEVAFLTSHGRYQDQKWQNLVNTLVAYMKSGQPWKDAPAHLQRYLNRYGKTIAYGIQDWHTTLSRMRVVSISDNGPQLSPGPISMGLAEHAAQILVWQEPVGSVRAQTMWWSDRANGHNSPLPANEVINDMRTWLSADGAWRMAVIVESALGGSDGTDPYPVGIALPPGNHGWMVDSAMLPYNVFAPYGPLDHAHQYASFADRAGKVIRIGIDVQSHVFGESHCCPHVEEVRLLRRASDDYHLQPWQVVPSPYATIVQSVTLAKEHRSTCTGHTLTKLRFVTDSHVGDELCAINWTGLPTADGPSPGKGNGPLVYSVTLQTDNGNTSGIVKLTLIRIHGQWLISRVRV